MAAAVVWCQSCKTAIWAYDALRPSQDVRGLCNMFQLPCPKCGKAGNFDGWNGDNLQEIKEELSTPDHPIYDWWFALKEVFRLNLKDGLWEISPDCSWYRRPDQV